MVDVRSLNIRDEVGNLRYEPAVDLGDVAKGSAPQFVQDPVEFFTRTHFTGKMKELVVKVFMNLLGLRTATVGGRRYTVSSSLVLLPSDLGGGKTHSLILLYHIFKLIGESQDRDDAISKLRLLDEDIANLVSENWDTIKKLSPKVIVADCKYSDLAPSPVKPIQIAGRRIKTLWGYLGYELGRYDFVRSADERETAPYADDIFRVLNESRAVILIDEIGRYYDQSGLEPTRISAFLMNLAEALSKYTVREVAVVVSLPYEVRERGAEAKAGMEYVHSPELIRAINEVLNRPAVEIIKPVERQDLAEILRKRIFSHTREEFEKFAEEFVTKELSREYPDQVRKVLDDRGFWREVRKSYPFHPAFLDVLEKLAYRLPYLQRTRDAIKIAVQTVLALKEGLFDPLEDKSDLVMPYHIPLFVSEALDETILRNAPSEYKVFLLILRGNIVVPENFDNVKKLSREEFYESIIVRWLRELREEDIALGVKLASVIWLHSLVGLGLPMNMGEFPTTADLIYSVSPTEHDVKGVLGILRSALPQLIVHGDPESDTARWFFASIPSIEELIEILKKNVTDEMAKNELAELLEWGLTGRRGRGRPPRGYRTESIFSDTVVVKTPGSVPKEVLESRDPSLIVFADKVSRDELLSILRGRNNTIVLAPHVKGIGDEEKLAPEDMKGIRELAHLKGRSVWEGLLEILRYYVAVESITEANLKSFLVERAGKGEEEYLEDVLKLLTAKVEGKRDYYYRHSWNMINKCYRRVYYYRQGDIRYEESLSLESDKPIPPVVEDLLREKGLIPDKFKGDNILSIVRDYQGKDPEEEPIKVGSLWNFILTTTKANVPLISYRMFLDAIKDLIRSLDYAVRIGKGLLWKPIFDAEEEAERIDEGSKLISEVSEYLRKTGSSWDDVELVYWEKVFDEWLDRIIGSIPSNKVIKVKDRSGNVLDIRDIKFDPKNTIKSGKLFYEEKKYPVELEFELPEEVWEGREYEAKVTVAVKGFENEVLVRLEPDSDLSIEPKELRGRPPFTRRLKLRAGKPGKYSARVEVYGGEELLDTRTIGVMVKGEWIEEEIEIEDFGKSLEEGTKVTMIKATNIEGLPNLIRTAKTYPGRVRGSIALASEEEIINFEINTKDPRVLEHLLSPVKTLTKLLTGAEAVVRIEYILEGEPELRDVVEKLVSTKGLRFKVKKRAVGG